MVGLAEAAAEDGDADQIGRQHQVVRRQLLVEADGRDGEPFVLLGGHVVRGPAVVADDAEHVVFVGAVARERPELAGHLGARRVGLAGEDGGQRAAPGEGLRAVVGGGEVLSVLNR